MKSVFLVTLLFFTNPFLSHITGEYRLDLGSRWDTLKILKNGKFEYTWRDGCFIEFDFQGNWQKQGDTLILFEKRQYTTFKNGTDEIHEEGIKELTHLFLIIPNGLKALTTDFFSSYKIYKKQN